MIRVGIKTFKEAKGMENSLMKEIFNCNDSGSFCLRHKRVAVTLYRPLYLLASMEKDLEGIIYKRVLAVVES